MSETSAGVLAWRRTASGFEVLLVHPGGPYWARKDEAGWSIPKGLIEPGEEGWAAAAREFAEELGRPIVGEPDPLSPCKTPDGKVIWAWLVEADFDVAEVRSNRFEMEWPRGSGQLRWFPEVDRAGWFDPETALWKVHRGQKPILTEAFERLASALLT